MAKKIKRYKKPKLYNLTKVKDGVIADSGGGGSHNSLPEQHFCEPSP